MHEKFRPWGTPYDPIYDRFWDIYGHLHYLRLHIPSKKNLGLTVGPPAPQTSGLGGRRVGGAANKTRVLYTRALHTVPLTQKGLKKVTEPL